MSKYHSPGRWAAGAFAGSMAILTGIGLDIASSDQADDVKKLNKAQAVVIEHNGFVEEASKNYTRVEKNIGEGCLALVRLYLPGGTLSSTPEDSVVSDLTSIPDKPCGNTQPEARISFRSLHSARSNIMAAEAKRVEAEDNVLKAKGLVDDPDWPDGMLFGSLGGVLVGSFGGFSALLIVDGHNRNGYYERPPK